MALTGKNTPVPTDNNPNYLNSAEMIALLRGGQHAALLNAYFGEVLYDELHALAVQTAHLTLPAARTRVYLLPGFMGSRLGQPLQQQTHLRWLDPQTVVTGALTQLALPSRKKTVVMGIMLPAYLKLQLSLEAAGFDVQPFPYDWRLSVSTLAKQLATHISKDPASKVMVVGHSMGGLVARAVLKLPAGEKITRLVQLGTPNQGSFALVQALRAAYPTLLKLAAVDQLNDASSLLRKVFCTFPSLYEMLPQPSHTPGLNLYDIKAWPKLAPRPQTALLMKATRLSKRLADADDRCHAVAGIGINTAVGVKHTKAGFVFQFSNLGDGTVALPLANWHGAHMWYAPIAHGDLSKDTLMCQAIIDLLHQGKTQRLEQHHADVITQTAALTEAKLKQQLVGKVVWNALPPAERRNILDPQISAEFKALCKPKKR